jgi:hypothetical protein
MCAEATTQSAELIKIASPVATEEEEKSVVLVNTFNEL